MNKHLELTDKHFFGSYFNLACNNIELVLNDFHKRYKITCKKDDSFSKLIDKAFTDISYSSDFEVFSEYLSSYFPIFRLIKQLHRTTSNNTDLPLYNIPEYVKSVNKILNCIQDLRDFYTHYYHKPLDILDDDCFMLIDELLLNTTLTVRKNRKNNENTTQLLKDSLTNEYQELCSLKKTWLIEKNYINTTKNTPQEIQEQIQNAVINDAFMHILNRKNDKIELSDYYTSRPLNLEKYTSGCIEYNQMNITQSGIVFLLCAFLNKKDGAKFRSNISGFKATIKSDDDKENFIDRDNNNLKFMATHWVYSFNAFKGFKKNINTSFMPETLLVQIVDELTKVPDEVYESLNEKNKKEFLEDINEYIQDFKNSKSLNQSTITHQVIRKRYENKFNYFAIRFLDEFCNFSQLRFQINLGYYTHNTTKKNIVGIPGETQRVIKEKINVFGRLSEVTSKKQSALLSECATNEGWEIYPNPSYNFTNNNIPIYLGRKDKILNQYEVKPPQRKEGKPKKFEITKVIGAKNVVNYEKPTAILSTNELFAILYLFLVEKKTGEEIEDIIKDNITKKIKLIHELTPESPISKHIPKKFRKATTKPIIDKNKLKRAIETEIKITDEIERVLKSILDKSKEVEAKNEERSKQSKSKQSYNHYLPSKIMGKLSTWLTTDMVRIMPQSSRENWKGYHNREFQARIGQYSNIRYSEAKTIYQSVWQYENDNTIGHEIKLVFNLSKNFTDLLKNHLNLRRRFLKRLSKYLNSNNDNALEKETCEIWRFFNKRIYTIDAFDSLKKKILSKPLALDRGLFDNKPTYIQGVELKGNEHQFANWYVEAYRYNNYQKFYDIERDYTDILNERLDKCHKEKHLICMDQDRLIKNKKIEDYYLFQIFKYLLNHIIDEDEKISSVSSIELSDFYKSRSEYNKEVSKANKQNKRSKGDKSENIIRESFVWQTTFPFKYKQISEPRIKLKDFGKFKQLMDDERVITIQSYDENRIWSKELLEREIESYERIRSTMLLKDIQELEKHILSNNSQMSHPEEFEDKEHPKFMFYITRGLFNITDEQKHTLEVLVKKDINSFKQALDEGPEKNTYIFKNEVSKEEFVNYLYAIYFIILIRNKISHNQLIQNDSWQALQQAYGTHDWDKETVAEYLLGVTKKIINDIKSIMIHQDTVSGSV